MPRTLYPRSFEGALIGEHSLVFHLPLTTDTTPTVAKGTATANFTRATSAMEDDSSAGVRTLTSRGSNVARISSRADTLGTEWNGYLAETEATNLIFDSEDYTASSWTLVGCNVSNDVIDGPLGTNTASSITESGILTFSLPIVASGVRNLEADLTINGTTVSPTFIYYGGDANATNWTAQVGQTLTAAGSGGSFNQGSPFCGDDDDSVNPDGTRYWQAGDNTFADITTEDIVIEAVIKWSGTTNKRLFGKWNGTSGYMLYAPGPVNMDLYLDDDGAPVYVRTPALVAGAWYHIIFFVDKSGNGAAYVNSVAGPSYDITSIGSMTAATPLILGAGNGVQICDSNIAYLAMWKRYNWLDTHLQADLAKERLQRLCGLYPQVAKGTALWNTYTRATTAHTDKVEYGAELLPEPIDFSAADWTKTNCSVTSATGITTPEGIQAYNLHEDDTVANQHRILDVLSGLVTGTVYRYSVDMKANNRDWAVLQTYADGTYFSQYFDVSSGVTGVSQNTIDNGIISLGNGWYRCWFDFLAQYTGNHNVYVLIGEFNNDSAFDGLDQDSLYIANASVKTWERKLYLMGAGFPRLCYRQEETDGADFKGYLPETVATNLCTDSEDFTAVAWVKTRCTVSGNMVAAPNNEITADGLYEDATPASTHPISDSFTQAASTSYVFSVWLKAVNRNWVVIQLYSPTDGSATAYCNLSTGTVGTESNNDDAGIEDWGNGWFRCWIKDTRTTAETGYAYVNIAEADNDANFDGLNQLSFYIFGAQVEASVDYPTSYIPTSGGTATRNADVLYYKGDDGNLGGTGSDQRGTMECSVLLPDVDLTGSSRVATSLSDGSSANDRITLGITQSGDVPYLEVVTGGVAQATVVGTTDVFDGDSCTIRQTWETNSTILYVNTGSEGTPDTSCVPPDDLDRIHIGNYVNDTAQINGLINQINIYNTPYAPGTERTHSTMDATIPLTSGHSYIFSTWAKAAGRNWLRMVVDGEDFSSYFDLSDGSVGTVSGVNVSAATENYGNDWYRCYMKYTANSTASRDHKLYIAESDNDITFDANNTVAMHVFGTQVETASGVFPTSYIQTSGGTATRNKDILWYQGDDGNIKNSTGQGTLECQILAINAPETARSLITLSDGQSLNDRIELGFTANGFVSIITAATGGNAGSVTGTTNILDGDVHTIRMTWRENRLRLYVDGTEEGTQDTSVDIPDDLDRIAIATDAGSDGQPEVLVREVKIYSRDMRL